MITWLTGNTGSGKTRVANALQREYGGILLDGDVMRTIWDDLGFTKKDREKQNLRVARLAKTLDAQGFDVIVATICPYKELRDKIYHLTTCKFITVSGGKEGEQYPYEY